MARVLFLGRPERRQPWFGALRAALREEDVLEPYLAERPFAAQLWGVDVVVDPFGAVRLTPPMLAEVAGAGVRLWQVLGVGLDHLDVPGLLARDIRLAHMPGETSARGLAEHALFLMLCLLKNSRGSQHSIQSRTLLLPVNRELAGRTLLVVGLGASGRAMAALAQGVGMHVGAVHRVPISAEERQNLRLAFCGTPEALEELLPRADVVSLHVPLTAATHRMIGRRQLACMKPDALLINVSRGAVLDEEALVEALGTGRLGGAGLDVFSREPVAPDHPLLALENVVATPHVAGVTEETAARRARVAANNVRRLCAGLPLLAEVSGPRA